VAAEAAAEAAAEEAAARLAAAESAASAAAAAATAREAALADRVAGLEESTAAGEAPAGANAHPCPVGIGAGPQRPPPLNCFSKSSNTPNPEGVEK